MTTLLVAAGVLIENGKVLLAQRKPGKHLALAWEFPGGKVEPDEDPRDALRRELHEELGIVAQVGDIVEVTFHRYPERAVLLMFYRVTRLASSPEPRALDVAAFRWATLGELDPSLFPAADIAVLQRVRTLLDSAAG